MRISKSFIINSAAFRLVACVEDKIKDQWLSIIFVEPGARK
jgi:hypothetical protein